MEQTGRPPRADGTRIRYVRCRMHQRAPEQCGNKTCTNLTDLQNVDYMLEYEQCRKEYLVPLEQMEA